MSTQQQHVAELLKALMARGVETKDALPAIKALVQARIFSLEDLNPTNVPKSIPKTIQKKLLKRKRESISSSDTKKRSRKAPIKIPPASTPPESITTNRSPVLILWTSIVAQRLFDLTWEESLSVGSAMSAKVSMAKGTAVGIYDGDAALSAKASSEVYLDLLGQRVPVIRTEEGLRGCGNSQEQQDPHSTWRLLQRKFGQDLGFCIATMQQIASSIPKDQLASSAWAYYVHIRPDIPQGSKGWGAHGKIIVSRLFDFFEPAAITTTKSEQALPVEKKYPAGKCDS